MKFDLNEPVYPTKIEEYIVEGMTIREYAYIKFAAATINGVYANGGFDPDTPYDDIADWVDKQARAMLKRMEGE